MTDPVKDNKALHILVEGHVQGVGFRYFVLDKAENLGVNGWVRNRYDGSVEILAEGQQTLLQNLLDAVHLGPSCSMVLNVKEQWQEGSHLYSQFSILPTE
jgi:acylphosphatase